MSSPLIVVAGGSSAAGIATATALVDAGMRVLTIGSEAERIRSAASLTGGALPLVCDLADAADVARLGAEVRRDHGGADGLIHLVGGWRGGAGLAEQSDTDWDFLHTSVLTTLRNTSREFHSDLSASTTGRLAIVSSTSVTAPSPGNANYAAVKAAAEAWVQAIAAGWATPGQTPAQGDAAAVVLVVKALLDDAMRARSPERRFPGYTDVSVLGQAVSGLFTTPAADLNGARIILDSNT